MRVSNIDVENASPAKRQRWAELQTEEVEKLYAEIQSKLKQIPKEQWTAWDVESLKRVEAILGDRRADEIRKDIERIMELAGLSYGLERQRRRNIRTKQCRLRHLFKRDIRLARQPL